MLIDVLKKLFERDLEKLHDEIAQYKNDADLWKTEGEITNSGGNLCLHLSGNLKHFFGSVLGNSGYVRDRDSEFALKDVPRSEMMADVDVAKNVVMSVLAELTEDDLGKPYPIEVFGHPMTNAFFLTHLATHLNYHLGQINYHRRLTR